MVAAEGVSGVGEEVAEQAVFVAGEVEKVAAIADGLRGFIMLPDGRSACYNRHGAAADGLDARDEFAAAEGFAQVVVSAEFETDDAVNFVVARGEEDEWGIERFADFPAECEAISIRQADVEQYAVERVGRKRSQRIAASGAPVDMPVFTSEGVTQGIGNGGVVFNEEDAF